MKGQLICECGRVAELRRRKNGRKLPFKVCKQCGQQQGREELREKWLAAEKPDGSLGVYGELAVSNETVTTVVSSQPDTSIQHQDEFQVPDELKPENCEPKITEEAQPAKKTSKNYGWIVKAAIGLAGLGLAFAGYNINIKQNQAQ